MKGAVWVLLLAACIAFQGCGYRLPGNGELPGHIKRVCIKAFQNQTGEAGFESLITNDIIYEFTRAGFTIPADCSHAGAVLTGTIQSAQSTTVSSLTSYTTAERRITIVVDVRLVSASGKILQSMNGLSDYQDYPISSTKTQTEENKKSAAAILFKRMAERIYYHVTADF